MSYNTVEYLSAGPKVAKWKCTYNTIGTTVKVFKYLLLEVIEIDSRNQVAFVHNDLSFPGITVDKSQWAVATYIIISSSCTAAETSVNLPRSAITILVFNKN